MNHLLRLMIRLSTAALIVVSLAATLVVSGPAPTARAASCASTAFLTFPTWYDGLPTEQTPNGCRVNLSGDINELWRIPLNIVEILLQVAAYAAVGYLIWGGFKYIKSTGNSSKIGEAKQTVLNAVIGLGIALAAVALVNFVAGAIT